MQPNNSHEIEDHENESENENEDLFEHFQITVDHNQSPLRIDKFLTEKIANAIRNKVQAAIESGNVFVNKQEVTKSNYKVKPGDQISVALPHPPRETEVKPENIPLDIVYEDEELLVVNKKAGMVVHPAYNNWSGTLVNALVYHFDNLPKNNSNQGRPGLVHRIDKDTSGLLVIAKTEFALAHLGKQFFDHSIERTYHALVWGCPENKEGTIDETIGRSQKDRRVMQVYKEGEGYGKHAITHYRVLKDLYYVSLVECRLETGRTHQIRAHMKFLGHPLFNDVTYGGDKILKGTTFTKYKQFVENAFSICPRQALHAKTLGFIHPRTKKEMRFESELPEDMTLLLEKWEKFASNIS